MAQYKYKKGNISQMTRVEDIEGETIEMKVERMVANKEPISDGAPEIFTERKDGVLSAYNIRTDRFELACEAMDSITRGRIAQRDNIGKAAEQQEEKKPEKGGETGGETESKA